MKKLLLVLLLAATCLITSASSCEEGDDSESSAHDAEIEARVTNYFELINANRMDEVYALFDANAELHAPFGYEETRGLENIKTFFDFLFSNSPVHHDVPVQIFVKGNEAAVFIEATGGASEAEATTITAMDRIIYNEEGKIVSLTAVLDTAPFLCP